MELPYRKDLRHLTWDEVFARQLLRASLVEEWMDTLHLDPGARVLDIGAGPGYVSLVLAGRVGANGLVYAVDRSADALAYLADLQYERGVRQIRRIVADATTLDPDAFRSDSALVTMVLHHANDPMGILASVARLLPTGALAVIGEFHPEGPCEKGPPRAERISLDQVRAWCEAAGFAVLSYRRQTQEHYMFALQRC
ncbi:MAG TPA: methyltransferase domain-containing protein [Burkholderiales bacterium]|nr:methyltransferase domain-containing protein [Burkholderiales bacterium]